MAKFFYEGNLNQFADYRTQNGVGYYIRGIIEVDGGIYERYGIHTHFVQVGEDYLKLIERYLVPFVEKGDLVCVSGKVISLCQRNIVYMKDVKVAWYTRLMSRFGKKTKSGIGITEPHKLQLMIDMKGLGKVLYAGVLGMAGKLFGKRGVFYRILGEDAAGIDGFYSHSAFEMYHTMAVLNPRKPAEVCNNIYGKYGIPFVIVDANDIAVHVLGKADVLECVPDEKLSRLVGDNPAGQDDERTPFIVVRKIFGNM